MSGSFCIQHLYYIPSAASFNFAKVSELEAVQGFSRAILSGNYRNSRRKMKEQVAKFTKRSPHGNMFMKS